MDDDKVATDQAANADGASPADQGAPQGVGADAQPAEVPKKFENSSKEDIAKSYVELEKKFHERDEILRQHKAFAEWMRPYLTIDGDNLDWDNNMLKTLAMQRGLLGDEQKPEANGQAPSSSPAKAPQEDVLEALEKDPDGYLKQRLKALLDQELSERLSPIQSYIGQDKNRRVVETVRAKYPDFDNYRDNIATMMQKLGWEPETPQQLEALYTAAKGASGGFVDKKDADQMSAMLQQTQSVLRQGGGQPLRNDDKASNLEVMGLAGPKGVNSDKLETLFGKTTLDD